MKISARFPPADSPGARSRDRSSTPTLPLQRRSSRALPAGSSNARAERPHAFRSASASRSLSRAAAKASSSPTRTIIDPNEHFCGSVPPHGHRERSHPETGFYTVGIKSYGSAPTFSPSHRIRTGRSVTAAIAGELKPPTRSSFFPRNRISSRLKSYFTTQI